MDPADIAAKQLEILQEINATLIQQRELMTANTNATSAQSAAFNELNQSAQNYVQTAGDQVDANNALKKSTEDTKSSWDMLTESMSSFADKVPGPLKDSFSLLQTNLMSLKDAIMNPFSAAVGFLVTAYDTILEKAVEYGKELDDLANRLEKVRDKFGSFAESSSARIREVANSTSRSLREAAGNTDAFASKFNMGVQGMIGMIDAAEESFESLGSLTDALGNQFVDSAAQLFVLRKGLAFSDEAVQQTARLAMQSGQSLKVFSQGVMKNIDQIGRAFGISTKVLGKDVGAALSNFKLLGKMTGDYVKEMVAGATFTRKLGFEIEKLTGLVDKFDEFEGGAEAAAQLAQGFGMVLDPLKMMNMQDPAARLQEMQRAFAATGRSVAEMTRQQRSYLASTTGLDEATLQLAFSSKGMAMSYDQIKASADGATKKQKTTEEVMNDLADNIENFIKPFQAVASFIKSFFLGLEQGFMKSRGFMDIVGAIARNLRQVFNIGEQVGRVLSKIFFVSPEGKGFSDFIKSLGTMFRDIANYIKDFANAIGDGANVSDAFANLIGNIFDRIKQTFFGAFENFSFGDMVAKAGKFFLDMILGGVKWMVGPKGLKSISASIRDTFKGKGKDGVANPLMDGLKSTMQELIDLLPQLLPLIVELGEAVIEMIFDFFANFPVTSLFVAGGPILTTLGDIVSNVFTVLGTLFGGGAAATGANAEIQSAAGQMSSSIGGGISNAVTTVVEGAGSFMSKLGDMLLDVGGMAARAVTIGFLITEIGGAVHEILMKFTQPQPPYTLSFVDSMALAAEKFKDIDPMTIAAVGGLLVAIMAAIGATIAGILYSVSFLPGGFEGIKQTLAALLGGTGLAWLITKVGGAVIDVMDAIITKFGTPSFFAGVKLIDSLNFSGIIGMVEAITAIMASIPKLFEALNVTGADQGSRVSSVVKLFADVKNVLLGGGSGVPENAGILGIMASISKNVSTYMSGKAEEGKETTRDNMFTMLSLKINAFSGLITSLGGLVGATAALTQVPSATARLMELAGEDSSSGFVSNLGLVKDSLNLAFADGGLSESVLAGIESLKKAMSGIDEISGFSSGLGTFVDDFDLFMDRITADRLLDFETRVAAVVDHVAMINNILRDLDTIPLNATIDKLESNMKLAKTTMSIAGGAVNVNVQLNVTMNAQKMSESLIIGGYVKPSDDFGEFMKLNDGINDEFEIPAGRSYGYTGTNKPTTQYKPPG